LAVSMKNFIIREWFLVPKKNAPSTPLNHHVLAVFPPWGG
jgi:hypothetical protein